jgi:DnaJ-class molecular chaperone
MALIPDLSSTDRSHAFLIYNVLFLLVLIGSYRQFSKGNRESQFRNREAERNDLDKILNQGQKLENAKLPQSKRNTPPPPPLQLPGINLNGEPHEVLGIRADASEEVIMKAYKDAIKRFHPDRIQGQAQDQIRFYQEASARINDAKNAMIKRLRG